MYEAQRKTLRRAERLIRKLDRFADGSLVEDGVPAQEIALELSMIANDLVVLEAIERVRPVNQDFHNVIDLHDFSRRVS